MITFIKDSFIPFYLFLVWRKILKDDPSETFSVKICGDSFPWFSASAIDACLHDLVDYWCIVSGDILFFKDWVACTETIEGAGEWPFLLINHDTGIVLLYLYINSRKLEEYLDQYTEAWYNWKHQWGHQINLIDPKIQVTRMITEFNSLIEKGYANDFIRYDFSSLLKRTSGDKAWFLYEMEQENQPFLSLWWLYKNWYLELDKEQLIQISDGDFFLFDGYMVISIKLNAEKIKEWNLGLRAERNLVINKNNGDIFYKCEKICNLQLDTQQFDFVMVLYKNIWNYISHEDIIKWLKTIDSKTKNECETSRFCSNIKRKLPKEIRDFIKTSKWHYMLGNLET